METIDNKIREYRKKQKLTQDELSAKVNVTRQTIVALEKGSYIPSLLLAMNLADVLDVKIEELFFKEEKK